MREFTVTAADGLELSAAAFEPEDPRGVVQIIHALREHKERYYDLAAFLEGQGYIAVIADLRGHGQSVNAKYFLGHFESANELLADQVCISDHIKATYPGLDISILADSQGSVIARLYLKDRDSDVCKLIMTGAFAPSPASYVTKGICSLACSMHHNNTVKGLVASYINSADENKLYANFTAATEYKQDLLIQSCKFTNGAALAMAEASVMMMKIPVHICGNPSLRILLARGENDGAVTPAVVKKTEKYMKRDGYKFFFEIAYPGDRHSILSDMNKDEFYKDIAMFLSD